MFTDLVTGRNPFDSLGDIAVAVKARRLPLPASLEDYGSSTGKQAVFGVSRGVADAGVRVSECGGLKIRGRWNNTIPVSCKVHTK